MASSDTATLTRYRLPPVALTRLARPALAFGAVACAGVVGEVAWTIRRELPVLTGIDSSGVVPGRHLTDPVRLVAMGDSTLTGPGLYEPGQIWLRRALALLERDAPVELRSLAVGGSRMADVFDRVEAARVLEPDLAVLAVGSNDAIHGTPLRRFTQLLERTLAALLEVVPVVAVANVGDLGNVARVLPPLNALLRARSRAICSAIDGVVGSCDGTVLLNVTTADPVFRDRSVFGADLFHPLEAGHAAWAEAALPGLRTAFDRLVEVD